MIRGGPPPPFGPRMSGNAPMFMRGQRPPGPGQLYILKTNESSGDNE